MNRESVSISIRLPNDVHAALVQHGQATGSTTTECILEAIGIYVASLPTTPPSVASRIRAETQLVQLVLERATKIREAAFDQHVTFQLFDWIQANHNDLYQNAVGPKREHAYRINPLVAKKFAIAIGGKIILNENNRPKMIFLKRNANKLIQSYSLLERPL